MTSESNKYESFTVFGIGLAGVEVTHGEAMNIKDAMALAYTCANSCASDHVDVYQENPWRKVASFNRIERNIPGEYGTKLYYNHWSDPSLRQTAGI